MHKETEIAIVRRAYAMRLFGFDVDDPGIEAAFAAVPREHYLGPGPWSVFRGMGLYSPTRSDDPVYVYSDQLFGLLPHRHINNGQPSVHVALLARAGIRPGEHVVHVGAGTGYYSAILAHIVGPTGRVTAIEFDPELAGRATANLAAIANVRVIQGDAFTAAFDPADVIYVNAAFSRISPAWLDGLREGGRLILPMTSRPAINGLQPGVPIDLTRLKRLMDSQAVFRIERVGEEFHVRLTIPAAFIPAEGSNDASDEALAVALEKGGASQVTRLYRRDDIPDEHCWLRGEGWCLAYS